MFFSAWRVKIFLDDPAVNMTLANGSDVDKNATDPISDEIWATRVGLFAIGGTTIAIFGLLCNSISIVILAHFRQRSSAPFLLICLEVIDSVLLLSEMLLETLTTLSQAGLLTDAYRDFIRPIYVVTYPVPHIAQTGTTMVTVLITLERYIVVAKPLLAATVCSKVWARRAMLVIVVYSLLFHVPLYLAYSYETRTDPETNVSKVVFYRTELGKSHFYNYWFVVWINLVFEFLLPFVLILVFNTLMIRALRASKKLQATSTSSTGLNSKRASREDRLTGMVIAVTFIFFVCELFPAITLIMVRGMDAIAECSLFCAHFMSVADTMVLVNSGVNFVVYCAIGKQFRDIFCRIFLRCRRGSAGGGGGVNGGGGYGSGGWSQDRLKQQRGGRKDVILTHASFCYGDDPASGGKNSDGVGNGAGDDHADNDHDHDNQHQQCHPLQPLQQQQQLACRHHRYHQHRHNINGCDKRRGSHSPNLL